MTITAASQINTASLVTREMQLQPQELPPPTHSDGYNKIVSVGKDVEKLSTHTTGGIAKQGSHFENQLVIFLKMLNIKLPYNPAILLLGMYLKKVKHTSTQKLIQECSTETLFVTGQKNQHSKCPPTGTG